MAKTRFHSLLEERLTGEIVNKRDSLAEGTAKDFGDYRYWVGYIAGLMAGVEIANDIQRENEGHERSSSA